MIATYSVTPLTPVVTGGDTAVFLIKSSNALPNTKVYWTVTGGSIADIAGWGAPPFAGIIYLDSTGQGTASVYTLPNPTNLTSKLLTLTLNTGEFATETLIEATPTYNLSSNASQCTEGNTATFLLSTTRLASGTRVLYTLSGVSSSDIVGGQLSGMVTVGSDGYALISVQTIFHFQGNETLTVNVNGATTSEMLISPAFDSYNSFNNQLTIPQVLVGLNAFSNVVITVGNVISVAGGSPVGTTDLYSSSNNELTIPAVKVGSTTYSNVVITVGGIVSINGIAVAPPQVIKTGTVTLGSTTPANNATNVNPMTNIVFNFSEPIVPTPGAVFTIVEPTGIQDSLLLNGNPLLKISGNTLTLSGYNPYFNNSGNYLFDLAANSILGNSGDTFSGVQVRIGIIGINDTAS